MPSLPNRNKRLKVAYMIENKTYKLHMTTRARWEFISFENTQRWTYPNEASNNFFCRKTSIFQQLLQNKKDRFYVLIYVQTDTGY